MKDNGITWTNEKRKLSELIPWPRNPRQIKKDQVVRLQESLEEFGQPEMIAIGPGNEIYNGHQLGRKPHRKAFGGAVVQQGNENPLVNGFVGNDYLINPLLFHNPGQFL